MSHLKDNMSVLNNDEITWAIEHDVIKTHNATKIRHMMDMEDPETTIANLRARIVSLELELQKEITDRLWRD